MALKKQDKNPVEIDETLQEQQYIDALVNKVSEAQKIMQPIRRNRLTIFSAALP